MVNRDHPVWNETESGKGNRKSDREARTEKWTRNLGVEGLGVVWRGCLPFITAGYPLMESSCPHLSTVLPCRHAVVISVLPNNKKSFVPLTRVATAIQQHRRRLVPALSLICPILLPLPNQASNELLDNLERNELGWYFLRMVISVSLKRTV